MEESFCHPVFLLSSLHLSPEVKKRVESYFLIRRKSGGGECGALLQKHQNIYCIAFKDKDAQQRVLQRSEHVLDVPGGRLVLKVQESPPTDSSGPNQPEEPGPPGPPGPSGPPGPASLQKQTLAASPPPSDAEYELRLNGYLIRFLCQCSEAKSEVEDELASLGCSAARYLEDEEKVVVRSSGRAGAAGDWRAQVDRVFDGYICHYELDPRRLKALLRSCRPGVTTDGVRAYDEMGLAVVVGRRSRVGAKLEDVEEALAQRSEAGEKQTSIRRLGEAKGRLLWKDVEQSLKESCPTLEVTQGAAGELVLTGSMEDIFKAGKLIAEKENAVLERMVSDKSPYFLAFLRRVYGGPGVLRETLGVDDEVELELGDTELHLFSLSGTSLDFTLNKIDDMFKEVKYEIPDCDLVPSELLEKLKSKSDEMNRAACRVQVVSGLDNMLWFLGHAKEVEELSECVALYILDKANVEGKVLLPFPELVQRLPDLLQLHNFEHSGVVLHPLAASNQGLVALEGPSLKVTEFRNRLGPFLDSLVQERITIDLPGAGMYFTTSRGRQSMLSVARSQKSLLQLVEQPQSGRPNAGFVKYRLQNGLQVLVCEGDITKQYADAVVNAANEKLQHHGGVAGALSKAGGPQVQKESNAIIKQRGKIPTGDAVMTTGGNLKCKKLVHVVGPVGGRAGGNESTLIEKAVHSAFALAESKQFKSIAIPCISSGVFGVPIAVCCEAIVTAIKKFSGLGGRSLNRVVLIDTRSQVVKALQDACDKILQASRSSVMDAQDAAAGGGAVGGSRRGDVRVELVQGTIETQQADVLASPVVGHSALSTRVGQVLANVVGPDLESKFQMAAAAAGGLRPGDAVVVEQLPSLRSKAVIFISLIAWNSNKHGDAVKVLRKGIQNLLSSCEAKGFLSAAAPLLGPGQLLQFPHSVAANVLLEELRAFEQNRTATSGFLLRVVLHPKNKEGLKAFQSARDASGFRGVANEEEPIQTSFYRRVSVSKDEVTAQLGAVKLQMMRGNITDGGADVIVNSTNFSNVHSGVSKAILEAAGPTVAAELAQVGVPAEFMCSTGPGLLGCKEIIHASFKKDPQIIRKNCRKILKLCERKTFQSVAFPAINTGMAGMDAAKACEAMLDGLASAVGDLNPTSLSLVRIVVMQPAVFKAFRSVLEGRFGQDAPRNLNLREKAEKVLKKLLNKSPGASPSSAPQRPTVHPFKPPPAVIGVIACGRDVIGTVKRDLETILQKELMERKVDAQSLARLDAMELDAVQAKVKVLGLGLERWRRQSSAATSDAQDEPGPGGEVYVLKGLKEDVLSVMELINAAVHKALCEDHQGKDEAILALRVQWSAKGATGGWRELGLHDNFQLEQAHGKQQVSVDVTTPDGAKVQVNLKTLEATDWQSGVTYKLERSEIPAAMELPAHWEPMHQEFFKKVKLHPTSAEFQRVAKAFQQTAHNAIQTIERVQNLYLWQAFSICKQRILQKNGAAHVGERSLYHGTSATSCKCIERDRFDRNFAGKHATRFGKGVYFAVHARYSANNFSPPDASGLKRLYVACVLTGRYTVGTPEMQAPPPRGSDPTDCYDSLVDDQQQPSMFVIFHDDQAYPEYLVTFT